MCPNNLNSPPVLNSFLYFSHMDILNGVFLIMLRTSYRRLSVWMSFIASWLELLIANCCFQTSSQAVILWLKVGSHDFYLGIICKLCMKHIHCITLNKSLPWIKAFFNYKLGVFEHMHIINVWSCYKPKSLFKNC